MKASVTSNTLPCAVLRIARVVEITGLSRTTLWRLEREGKFPRRVRLSERLVGHKEADVRLWVEERECA